MWHEQLRATRRAAGLSLRELAAQVHYSRGYLHDLETGRRRPNPETAARLGLVLGVDLPLSDEDERLSWTAAHPFHPEPGSADHLSVILAGLRRLEDNHRGGSRAPAGAGPRGPGDLARGRGARPGPPRDGRSARPVDPVRGLAPRGDRESPGAGEFYGRALGAALGANRLDLAATALSMRGHLSWQTKRPGPLLSLTEAALRQAVGPV
ncbi:helix-turn-helix transcriptional regulator [Actinoplanes sp. NPDC049316]|uniref:helix-turn-helix domain-containing protein n=1 Tax=Actinoplanes sp. NPDC049316 TaxID=3154727 RepID=UPI00341FF72A